MDSAEGFISVIGKISTLIGFGTQLDTIFGGSAPLTIADIEQAIRQDVADALQAQALTDEMIAASATLKSVQQFFSIDYLQSVNAGIDDAGLYGVLTNSTIGKYAADMQEHVQTLQTWMNQSDLRTAAAAIPVSLGLHLYTAIIHRERAKRVPTAPDDGDTHRAELALMRGYAQAGVQDIAPRLINLMNVRQGSFEYRSQDKADIPGQGYCVIDSVHDTWIDSWLYAFKMFDDDTPDYADALRWVLRASRNLLWSGAQADADDFARSLTDGWLNYPGRLREYDPAIGLSDSKTAPYPDNFRNACLVANTNFGKFVQSARTSLLGLDAIALGYAGSEQENWSWCSSCGGLYYAGWRSFCPATKGPHVHEQPTGNYALRCSPTGPSVLSMQDNWRWCKKCGGLFYDSGPRACAAGGAHDASGSGPYELDVGGAPGLNVLGLPDAQDNWRWCSKCSLLHFGVGASVCPGEDAHDSSGGNYWLNMLGALPQR